jgi:hypothetical protein
LVDAHYFDTLVNEPFGGFFAHASSDFGKLLRSVKFIATSLYQNNHSRFQNNAYFCQTFLNIIYHNHLKISFMCHI